MKPPTNGTVNVAVLGAAGTIAPAIVTDLAASAEVGGMVLLDLDASKAEAVSEAHGGGRSVARAVDARDTNELAAALDGIDALVNTASYRVNLDAMRACLTARCHYLDLGGLYWLTVRQLELSQQFERAGLLAVLGIGSSPGKTNLMAARAMRELDGSGVRSLEVCAAGRDPRAGDAFSPPYAVQTLLDELTMNPVVLRDGIAIEIEPLADGGEVEFGDPIGAAETIYTLHSELATFGSSFGASEVSFRLSLAPRLLARLKQLVGASNEAIADAARDAVQPSSETTSVHMVRAVGSDGGSVTVRARTDPWSGLGGSIVSTAAPIAAAVRLLARGSLTAVGTHPPELCIDPDELFAELETRGCSFSVQR
ncbi:MAG TPA: saccharopine dehydrogenase NADP-binding domain-containing protein [Solirubrobacteraceae bacterium]|jgi:saccharopine dehydrogenase (NAD+, L-lysine-forming)|nr:saccharopine dehydrogenase NADP-binding domain-containing protein [Solirubrobacteraceae bacterium]